jgi:hypothetical protein
MVNGLWWPLHSIWSTMWSMSKDDSELSGGFLAFLAFSALVTQFLSWGPFFVNSQRVQPGPQIFGLDFILVGVNVWVLVRLSMLRANLVVVGAFTLGTVSQLLGAFSYLYWSFGSRANFNMILTHLDAVYFTLGTLTTAGTGSIAATSEAARYIQSLQMLLDLGLMVFAVGIVISRFSSPKETDSTG